jgi:hypothetical protein
MFIVWKLRRAVQKVFFDFYPVFLFFQLSKILCFWKETLKIKTWKLAWLCKRFSHNDLKLNWVKNRWARHIYSTWWCNKYLRVYQKWYISYQIILIIKCINIYFPNGNVTVVLHYLAHHYKNTKLVPLVLTRAPLGWALYARKCFFLVRMKHL